VKKITGMKIHVLKDWMFFLEGWGRGRGFFSEALEAQREIVFDIAGCNKKRYV
jgi:hypothetical protein